MLCDYQRQFLLDDFAETLAKENLADLNERGADAVGRNILGYAW